MVDRAYSLFAELQGTLIGTDPEQLHASSFIWGKTGDLSDNIAHEFSALSKNLRLELSGKSPENPVNSE